MTESFWSQFIPIFVTTVGSCGATAAAVAKWYLTRKLEQDKEHHNERLKSDRETQELLGMVVSMQVAVMSDNVKIDDVAKAITERVKMQFKAKSHENPNS